MPPPVEDTASSVQRVDEVPPRPTRRRKPKVAAPPLDDPPPLTAPAVAVPARIARRRKPKVAAPPIEDPAPLLAPVVELSPRPPRGGPPRALHTHVEDLASSATSVVELPPRSTHDPAAPRNIRRRRSVTRAPAVVAPMDVPEDAPGRVEILVVHALADRNEAPFADPAAVTTAGPTSYIGGGWIAVAVVAMLLVVVFVLGSLLLP